jgi:hypothetical protein
MAKVKITGHASGSGVLTITAPNTSTDRTVTLPDSTGTLLDTTSGLDATKLSGTLPALNGSSLTGVAGRKNMVINGAMQVAQRGTSATGIDTDSSATELYRTVDRFLFGGNDSGVWTMTQDSDSPVGFGSSMKLDCTTAKSSLDAGSYLYVLNRIEAQDLQHLGYGTSSPQAITLSFWVKSPKTGTHYAELYHMDSSGSTKRKNSYAYTVSSANTWEKKSMTFAGNTGVNAINNDTGSGLMLMWYLAAGGNLQGGTNTNDNWQNTEANRTPGQVNVADSTSNNFYLTGVQLEVGSVATDFEHRSFGEELALCQRYFEKSYDYATLAGTNTVNSAVGRHGTAGTATSGEMFTSTVFKVEKRAAPTVLAYSTSGNVGKCTVTNFGVTEHFNEVCNEVHITTSGCHFQKTNGGNTGRAITVHYTADAEL